MNSFINLKNRALALIILSHYLIAATLLTFSVLMALVPMQKISAAQLTQRKITLSTSEISATSATYSVSFRVTQTTIIRGAVVEICQNSPLIGASCTTTNGVTATPTTGTVTFTNTGSTGDATFEVHANSTATGRYIVTDSDGATGGDGFTPATGADFTFSFTATNPSGTASTSGAVGTFYARILTYGVAADAAAYTPASPGTHLDDGGVALSTARRLTVNARVQEELEFCVGAVDSTVVSDATTPANCSAAAFSGTTPTVDLGVVSSSGASISPVAVASGGNNNNGAVMIRTNAFNGAVITYFAGQNAGSGRLKVAGATCNTTGGASAIDAGSGNQDQCFNSNNTKAGTGSLADPGEKFGMTISSVYRPTGSTTTNLSRNTEYDGTGLAAGGWAWRSDGTIAQIAASTTVLDYEMLLLRFAARAAATTPTGFYTNTSTYVATSTF